MLLVLYTNHVHHILLSSTRFPPESDDGANAGLDTARKILAERIQPKHPAVSVSDLWILAALVFLETSGGPVVSFRPGRTDAPGEHSKVENGRLPDAEISYDSEAKVGNSFSVLTSVVPSILLALLIPVLAHCFVAQRPYWKMFSSNSRGPTVDGVGGSTAYSHSKV